MVCLFQRQELYMHAYVWYRKSMVVLLVIPMGDSSVLKSLQVFQQELKMLAQFKQPKTTDVFFLVLLFLK